MTGTLQSGSCSFTVVHKIIFLSLWISLNEDESESPLGQEKRMYITALELIPLPVNILFSRNSRWSAIIILRQFLNWHCISILALKIIFIWRHTDIPNYLDKHILSVLRWEWYSSRNWKWSKRLNRHIHRVIQQLNIHEYLLCARHYPISI